MDLSKQMREKAASLGLCKEHVDGWSADSIPSLIDYYMTNPGWCLERQFPSSDMLREFADSQEMRDKGFYINHCLSLSLTNDRYVFNNCTGHTVVDGFSVIRIYAALDSQIDITVKDHSVLFIDLYDNARVNINNSSKRIVRVYNYGNGEVAFEGNNVIVKDKKHG